MDIAYALSIKWPNSLWRLNGDDYANLEWLSDDAKPTLQELEIAYQQAAADRESLEAADAAAREAAIAHAKSLGFTDDMIAVMYPGLTL